MKKNQDTELTFEQIKEQAMEQYEVLSKQPSFGEPTYFFKVGDKVRVGNLSNCVVDEITNVNGTLVYGISHDINKHTNQSYQYTPWYNVRPFEIGKGETSFAKKDDIRIRFYNTSLEGLLNKFYLSGIEMDPPYQRGYVWDNKDKESLLDSIFNRIEIGKFAFIQRDYSHDVGFEILDGKQRLSTLLDFYENRLAYKGVYYNDLSVKDRNLFLNAPVTIGETENLSMEQIYNYFYTLNKCGKVMDEKHLEMIREQIVDELESEVDSKFEKDEDCER